MHICCSDDDDDDGLAQLELKNQRQLPLPFRPPGFYDHWFSLTSLAISMSTYFSSGTTLCPNRPEL
jgi:hypothetical protein